MSHLSAMPSPPRIAPGTPVNHFKRQKFVYFIRPEGEVGPIKIGCSLYPLTRLYNVMIWSPIALELLCYVPGNHGHERALHAMFADARLHSEWFTATDELLAVVRHCQQFNVLPEFIQERGTVLPDGTLLYSGANERTAAVG